MPRSDGPSRSAMEVLAMRPRAERSAYLENASGGTLRAMAHHWPMWRRPGQLPPGDEWRVWLVMGGRGFGKTRMGAEWVREVAEVNPTARVALVGATVAEVRRVMVEGESGLLSIAPADHRPTWEPSLGRLCWPRGGIATVYSAAEPEALRGAQHSHAWADEIAKWPEGVAAWDNLMLTMRVGKRPRTVATTTPRPVPLVRRLLDEKGVAVTGGRTGENRAHLAQGFLDAVEALYGGTRLARQELNGELVEGAEDALWSRDLLELRRVRELPPLVRVVVGVDPPAGTGGDACGIVAVGLGEDRVGYVLEDASVQRASPEAWARAVAACAVRHGADRVVAEANQGGAMVESVLRAAQSDLPVRLVHASRGKAARAEPISALYEKDRVRHLRGLPDLEDELCGLVAGGGYHGPGRSPDRADAAVWALTELMLSRRGDAAIRMM